MRLASFGNDHGSKDTVDVLRRSLVIRNKSYKELMTKCNVLGRGEAKCLQKLDKANEKIKKLKLRVQELETALEIRDNDALRALKHSQDCKINTRPRENLIKGAADKKRGIDDASTRSLYDESDEKRDEVGNIVYPTISVQKDGECKREAFFAAQDKAETLKSGNEVPFDIDDEVFCYGKTNPVETLFHIRKETMPCPPSTPGEHCFSGNLLGPEQGANFGKWCKKVVESTKEGSKASPSKIPQKRSWERSGDLIAVGADGRGGTVKVMRSLHRQPTLDTKVAAVSSLKKIKPCPKTNGLQIEHFFRRANS